MKNMKKCLLKVNGNFVKIKMSGYGRTALCQMALTTEDADILRRANECIVNPTVGEYGLIKPIQALLKIKNDYKVVGSDEKGNEVVTYRRNTETYTDVRIRRVPLGCISENSSVIQLLIRDETRSGKYIIIASMLV